jgi:hypothetical protein
MDKKLIYFIVLFSLVNLLNTNSPKNCEEIIKSKLTEEEMILLFEENMLEIKKDTDK